MPHTLPNPIYREGTHPRHRHVRGVKRHRLGDKKLHRSDDILKILTLFRGSDINEKLRRRLRESHLRMKRFLIYVIRCDYQIRRRGDRKKRGRRAADSVRTRTRTIEQAILPTYHARGGEKIAREGIGDERIESGFHGRRHIFLKGGRFRLSDM